MFFFDMFIGDDFVFFCDFDWKVGNIVFISCIEFWYFCCFIVDKCWFWLFAVICYVLNDLFNFYWIGFVDC